MPPANATAPTTAAPAADPASVALATSAPVGTNAPVPVAAASAPLTAAPVALTSPTYNYADNVSSGQALQDLTDFQTHQQSPVDAYNAAVTQLGIPDVRTNVTNLRKQIADTTALLNALPDSVTGRTTGSLVTDAQRSRILGMERAPLDQANAQYSTNYNAETANLNDLTGQAQNQAALITQGNKNTEDALNTRYTGIKSAEDTKRAQDEADRQYAATMAQIQAQQAQFAKTFALQQAQFSEGQRQFNASLAMSQAAAAAPTAQSATQSMLAELQQAANVYKSSLGSNSNGAREALIQGLTTKYGSFVDPKTIAGLVYGQYIPDSLEAQNRTKGTTSAIAKIAGYK